MVGVVVINGVMLVEYVVLVMVLYWHWWVCVVVINGVLYVHVVTRDFS